MAPQALHIYSVRAAAPLAETIQVGSVGNLYASIDRLDGTYVQAGAAKDALLSPTVLSPAASANGSLLRLPETPSVEPKTFYRCPGNSYTTCRTYVTDVHGKSCPTCGSSMTTAAQYISPGSDQQAAQGAAAGLVQGVVTYTVLDNLTVTPMSAISGITLLNTFGVTDIGTLQEKTVPLGYEEVTIYTVRDFSSFSLLFPPNAVHSNDVLLQGLEILRVALQSKTVLTDVFLGMKRKA